MNSVMADRRVATGANAIVVTILAVAIAVVAAIVARQLAVRIDLSSEGLLDLDPDTIAALAVAEARGADIEITAFSPQAKDGEAVLRARTMRDFTATLAQHSPRVRVSYVDFDKDRLVAERKGVDRYGTLVVEARGDRVDIKDRELFRARGAKGARTVEFIGEGAIAAAIRKVLAGAPTTIYLTSGHGELEIFDRGLGELKALSTLFEAQGWTVRTIDLLRDVTATDGVPADAAAILVLAPRAPFAEAEQDLLRSYVGSGGSLGVWLEGGQAAGTLFDEVGLRFPEGVVLDPTHVFPNIDRPVLQYGRHPITEALAADGLATVVSVAAPVEVAPRDGVTVGTLLQTSRMGWAERGREQPPAYDPAVDGGGPVVVAVAATLTAPQPWMKAGKAGRIAVTGDTDGLKDELLDGAPGNGTYVTNVVRWLVKSDQPLAPVGRPKEIRTLSLSESQLGVVRALLVVVMPLITALAGAAVLWGRRSR